MGSQLTEKSCNSQDNIVCFCRQVNLTTICKSIDDGAANIDDIRCMTGASSECGSCQPVIQDLLGEQHWHSVKLSSVHHYSENYIAFRFARVDGKSWDHENPGAYFVLQSKINGQWIGRPYAITDDGSATGLREIIVKRKQSGFFSNWLFDHVNQYESLLFRVSSSLGGSIFKKNNADPIAVLVGGIGVTPALALCRTLEKNKITNKIVLDISSNTEDGFFCKDELSKIQESHPLVTNFRNTSLTGRMTQTDVQGIVSSYAPTHFYICGSETYKQSVIELLKGVGVSNENIIDIESTYSKDTSIEAPIKNAEPSSAYKKIGVALLSLYFLQEILKLKIGFIESLQSELNYKIISGIFLLLYILLQWRLPIARWLKVSSDYSYKLKVQHQNISMIAPLVFYLHSTSIGYAYLVVLSGVYFSNCLVGYGSGEFVSMTYRKLYVSIWTVLHIGLSINLLCLSIYHLYIALAYK